ncbi:DsbA family protein [Halomarina oriensis]
MYADYACPFCYLQHQVLKDGHDEALHDVEIEWHPYDLRHEHEPKTGAWVTTGPAAILTGSNSPSSS